MEPISAGIMAGGSLAGGALDQAVFQPKQRQQAKEDFAWEKGTTGQAQVARINDALAMLMGEGGGGGIVGGINEMLLNPDHSGLKATASRNFTQNSAAARAALEAAGLSSSGVAGSALSRAYSNEMAGLSQAINEDMFRRQSLASQNTLQSALAMLAASQNPAFGDAALAEEHAQMQADNQGGK